MEPEVLDWGRVHGVAIRPGRCADGGLRGGAELAQDGSLDQLTCTGRDGPLLWRYRETSIARIGQSSDLYTTERSTVCLSIPFPFFKLLLCFRPLWALSEHSEKAKSLS